MARSDQISPTAYATADLWYRQGWSHRALVTAETRRLGRAVNLLIAAIERLSGFSLRALMLARHRAIDACLEQAIEDGRVQQVIELAAGLSPRGWRFMRRYGGRLTYVETDLPHMVRLKQQLLEQGRLLTPGHQVIELDALAEDGPGSLAAVAASLDPAKGTAIITEGLMNYLDPAAADGVWRRIASTLRGFPRGLYLCDMYLLQARSGLALVTFGVILSGFVRGRLHRHFDSAEAAQTRMQRCGFAKRRVRDAREFAEARAFATRRGGDRVRVLQAET